MASVTSTAAIKIHVWATSSQPGIFYGIKSFNTEVTKRNFKHSHTVLDPRKLKLIDRATQQINETRKIDVLKLLISYLLASSSTSLLI